jgi:hypothetical protein
VVVVVGGGVLQGLLGYGVFRGLAAATLGSVSSG